ncbi:MAG TPA: hypothetical protein VIL18_12460 [Longimicrobiales bacterium]
MIRALSALGPGACGATDAAAHVGSVAAAQPLGLAQPLGVAEPG